MLTQLKEANHQHLCSSDELFLFFVFLFFFVLAEDKPVTR